MTGAPSLHDVSVVCPVYNPRATDLSTAVASVLAQGSGVRELILADDASTAPESRHALDEAARADPRVVVLRSPSNAGPAVARNIALSHASGAWIGFIDADDVWPADKLSLAARALRERPDSQWIVGDFAILWQDGPAATHPALPCFEPGDAVGARQVAPALSRSILMDGMHLGSSLIRRSLIGERRFDPAAQFGEDLLFLIKLSLAAGADRAPGLSYLCRRQHTSMMWSPRRLSDSLASGVRIGLRDPELRAYRPEYRAALYVLYKDLAANNWINGRRMRGLSYAARALGVDARGWRDFGRYLRLAATRNRRQRLRLAKWYNDDRETVEVMGLTPP